MNEEGRKRKEGKGTNKEKERRKKEEGRKKEGERIEEPPLLVNPRTIRQLTREADFTLRDRYHLYEQLSLHQYWNQNGDHGY